MELELNSLIEKIKEDGILEAEKKTNQLVKEAEKRAQDITEEANKKKDDLIKDAQNEAERLKAQSEEAIRQAVRDSLLMLKQNIITLFDNILVENVNKQMDMSILQKSIIKLIENFRKDDVLDIEILLGGNDKKELEKKLLEKLSSEMRKGIIIKVSKDIKTGFRIGEKDKNYYYDFTDKAISDALKQYLNSKLLKIINNENQ